MKAALDFLLNGERVSLAGECPSRTLLTWLREARGLVGTKEGCAEGDCGACTVVLADLGPAGKLRYQPVNACILCLGALEGKEVITVEGLKKGDRLHAVQQAMVDCHGSQCGFCTPGFVMALYAHCKSGAPPELSDAVAGNLCRCTGYRPILHAGKHARELADWQQEAAEDATRAKRIAALPQETMRLKGFYSPLSVAEFARDLAERPKACVLAGGTDAGLWITKQHRDLEDVAYIGRVAELRTVRDHPSHIEIGAAVTYAEAYEALERIHPDIGELLRRLGAVQVRAAGTLAGNVANGSPIGDSMPVLLALDATLVLQKGEVRREARLARFYTGYRQSLLVPGEFIRAIRVPKLAQGARFAAYKLSKRFDQDISSVCAAFHVQGSKARFGFGGMAAMPARARQAEAAYVARGVEAACTALVEDFSPISDQRASAWYRLRAAQALLRKFHAGASPRALLDMAP
ncbi:MAG TPA: xanthine dehydrogenase small subunit [Burkholderiales bacterium]|jgi:xanthine dehydrogenase small subunit